MATTDPHNTPALPPPNGREPNFVDPKSIVRIIIATTVICICFTSLATLARLIVRLSGVTRMYCEDYTAFTAWGAFMAYNGLQIYAADLAQGRHQWDVSVANLTDVLPIWNGIEVLYGPAIFVAKLTVFLQFIRIFCPTKRGVFYQYIRGLIWANLIFYLVDTLVLAFACTPRSKISHPNVPGHCINSQVNFIITGAWNVFSDFSILCLPLSSVWKLQIATKKKLWLSAVFGTGFFACVASVIRLVYSVQMAHLTDTTYIIGKVAMWSCAEMATIILAASLPILPKTYRLVIEKLELQSHKRHFPTISLHYAPSRSTKTYDSTKSFEQSSKTPLRDPGGASWQLGDSYLPIQEPDAIHQGGTRAERTRISDGTQWSAAR